VDVEAVVDLAAPAATVFAEIKDLDGYPRWLSIVRDAAPAGPEPAWLVNLSTGIGPLRLTKSLRMCRAAAEEPRLLRFERSEIDDRVHSAWTLTATIEPTGAASSRLTMNLHYGGVNRLPLVDLALREEIRRAGPRLQRLLGRANPPAS
jgi:uncharacterized protein YndB with AHSA1/START domain